MYHPLVLVHVLSAIVALGYNATYAVWLARGSMQREHLLFALRGIKVMDDRVANPAYFLLLLTGSALVALSGRPWHQAWLEWALGLWVALLILAYGGYGPRARESNPDSDNERRRRSRLPRRQRPADGPGRDAHGPGGAIVGLMVFRPGDA